MPVSLTVRFKERICSGEKQTHSSGTKQSLKISSLAGHPFWPTFFSMRPNENPLSPVLTASTTVFSDGLERSEYAITMCQVERWPFEIKTLVPFILYPPGTFSA